MVPLGSTVDELRSCNIYTSICKSLGSVICPEYPTSTMCQEVITVQGDTYYYDMGSYTSNTEFQPLNGICAKYQKHNLLQCIYMHGWREESLWPLVQLSHVFEFCPCSI